MLVQSDAHGNLCSKTIAPPNGKSTTRALSPAPPQRLRLPSKKPMLAKPKLGQNFLNDAEAIERIANSLGDLTGRTVIEIGPGRGAITTALVARAKHVIAVELDALLAERLRADFPPERLTVVHQDVLSFDF